VSSQWESLEVAVAGLLTPISGLHVYTAAQMRDVWPPTSPGSAALIECYSATPYEVTIFNLGLVQWRQAIRFKVAIVTRSGSSIPGGARLGTGGTYDLSDQVKTALFSTSISLPNSGAFVPDLESETAGMIGEGIYVIEQSWNLRTTFSVCYVV
jgi:hypothetical protein